MIYFTHLGLQGPDLHHAWAAIASGERVATIQEVEEGHTYTIVYQRLPGRPTTQPQRTTRTVHGDLDHAQDLVQRRGWR
jgi:hypothetical protein